MEIINGSNKNTNGRYCGNEKSYMLVGTKDTNITNRIQVLEKRSQALEVQ